MSTVNQTLARAYTEHQHTVVLVLVANGAPLERARELAHDAWARIFERARAQRFDSLEFPGLVIRQAMYLLAESRHRDTRVRRRDASLDEAHGVEAAQASPEETVAGRQLLGAVERTLAHRSPRARSVLAAVVSGPDTMHAELARAEGVSLQRFRQILCEVRAQLRVVLGRGEP